MKRFIKICLIICGVLAVFGLVLCVIGAGRGFGFQQFKNMAQNSTFRWENGIDISLDNTTEEDWAYESEQWSAEEINNLDIQFDFGTLILEQADGENMEVEAGYRNRWNSYNRSIGWKVKGDTLVIEDTWDQKILKLFHHSEKDATLTIRIPAGKLFDEVSLEIGAASVVAETELIAAEMDIVIGAGEMVNGQVQSKTLQAEELRLEIGAGNMELYGIQAGQLDIDCGAGNMELTSVTAENTDLDCGVGRITMELTGQEQDYNYEIDCGIGQVVIGDSSYSGLGASKTIKNGGNKSMDIDCGIGEVAISFNP